jgi:hypothetical protein
MFSTTPTATVADGVQGTPYTVAQLVALGSTSFLVAIDVNTTAAAGETLQLFQVIINGVVVYDYIGPTVIGGVENNGNGFGDWTLGTIRFSWQSSHRHGLVPRCMEQRERRRRVVLPSSAVYPDGSGTDIPAASGRGHVRFRNSSLSPEQERLIARI